MAKLNFNSDLIQDLYIEKVSDNAIHLTVVSEYNTLRYKIIGDSRYTIEHIEQRLNDFKNTYQDSEGDLGITEYLERMYIFVTYPDGETEQYTATRIWYLANLDFKHRPNFNNLGGVLIKIYSTNFTTCSKVLRAFGLMSLSR